MTIKLELLKDEPKAVEQVARWYFDEWANKVAGVTVERVIAKLSGYQNRTTVPLMILARLDGKLVGAVELKRHEMDIYPNYEYWLGGLYVDPEARGRGVGDALVAEVLKRARNEGIEKLYLQTENLTGGLYPGHGFQAIEQVDHKGYRVLVMVADIGA